jgi:hypothetical protein
MYKKLFKEEGEKKLKPYDQLALEIISSREYQLKVNNNTSTKKKKNNQKEDILNPSQDTKKENIKKLFGI